MTLAARVGRFWGVGALGFVLQTTAIAWMVDGQDWYPVLATPLAVMVTVVHNFVWHRRWTWADRRTTEPARLAFARFVTANGLVSLVVTTIVFTSLVTTLDVPAFAANAVAVAVCSVVTFVLGDVVVFRRAPTRA